MDFGQRVSLEIVEFLVDFSVDLFPACFPKENGPKKSTKKIQLRKPNTKIHQKFQRRGVPDIVYQIGSSADPPIKNEGVTQTCLSSD